MADVELSESKLAELSQSVRARLAKMPQLSYGTLTLGSRYLLSPLAGYTNLPFRRIVREVGGVGLATTDLVNARGLMDGSAKSLQLIETCPEDRPFAVQLFGSNPAIMRDAAQFLEARGIDSIDINMGCPVHRITKGGAGASMMCQVDSTVELVRLIVESVKIPVTVKMRLGWDQTQLTAPKFAREFEQVGVAAVAIHGRTREQGFSGVVDRDGIRQVVEAVEKIPVIGNGDIRTVADGVRMFAETGCHGISMGRGALANPWIFRQFVEWETTGQANVPGHFEDRLGLLLKQFSYLEQQRGTERAIVSFRKMAHWYLKAMCVNAHLRNQMQSARTREEFVAAVEEIAVRGPSRGSRTGVLPELAIPVPSGPIENW
ncbi:tRNA dihydrouridine synthase DusB [Schlesneria paludicola]|uniref:tRNA dihydrouridine synthase DusB n=1 Tax=Schlesneria paludicola TaxID=360056 RepID=UPI000299ED73|nr:tRNA dihydrouridine synthase DusB [Schlesneria paludicola]